MFHVEFQNQEKDVTFHLNDLDEKGMKKALLATTAVPMLYQPVEINGVYYVDPMKYERAPLRPLLETDCETISLFI